MKLNDVYKIVKAIEDTLPDIAKENNGQNIRSNIQVLLNVSPKELNDINKELYQQVNKPLYEYEEPDEVIVEVFGIKVNIKKQ